MITNVLNGASVSQYAGPSAHGGFWNDGSLQLIPGMMSWDVAHNITNARHRSQFGMWSMLAMNILLTGNMSALPSYVIETWTNTELLAVNQDPLGFAAVLLAQNATPLTEEVGGYPPARVAECGGEPDLQHWGYNSPAPFFLRNSATALCLNAEACGSTVIYDFCNTNGTSCGGGHGDFHPNEQWNISGEGGRITSRLPGNLCLTVPPSGTLVLAPCETPVPSSQHWTYDRTTAALISGDGLCLTAPVWNV